MAITQKIKNEFSNSVIKNKPESKELNVLEKALAHYDRMDEYASKQNPEEKPERDWMKATIGENWFGEYCSFCQANQTRSGVSTCDTCSLNSDDGCCGGLWHKMSTPLTWGSFRSNLKKVRKYIVEHGTPDGHVQKDIKE